MSAGLAVCGMNGAGKSTLAKALANALGLRFLDIENYYFPPADPPFSVQRDKSEVVRLLRRDALAESFVFASVSPDRYGVDDLISAVFWVEVPLEVRIPRIRARDPAERKARARIPKKPFFELDGERPISENVNIILNYINEYPELSP